MKITKIEKKKRLYLLEIDEDDKLYVTEDTIVHFMLSKNMEIDDKTLKKSKSTLSFHTEKILHFIKSLLNNAQLMKSKNILKNTK